VSATLSVNSQEYETLKEWLPPDTIVVKPEELGTDAVVNGLEKNRMYERKDCRDLVSSIHDGRIWAQLKTLSDNIPNGYEPFIIMEGLGFYDWTEKKWKSLKQYFDDHPDRKMSFYEALTAFRAFKVGLVITVDKQDTALFLSYEKAKLGKPKEKKEYPERGGFRKDWDTPKKQEYLLECFGPKAGKALLKALGSNWGETLGHWQHECPDQNGQTLEDRVADIRLDSGRRIGTVKAKEIIEVCGFT
jgi:ERCC4-type nuclease